MGATLGMGHRYFSNMLAMRMRNKTAVRSDDIQHAWSMNGQQIDPETAALMADRINKNVGLGRYPRGVTQASVIAAVKNARKGLKPGSEADIFSMMYLQELDIAGLMKEATRMGHRRTGSTGKKLLSYDKEANNRRILAAQRAEEGEWAQRGAESRAHAQILADEGHDRTMARRAALADLEQAATSEKWLDALYARRNAGLYDSYEKTFDDAWGRYQHGAKSAGALAIRETPPTTSISVLDVDEGVRLEQKLDEMAEELTVPAKVAALAEIPLEAPAVVKAGDVKAAEKAARKAARKEAMRVVAERKAIRENIDLQGISRGLWSFSLDNHLIALEDVSRAQVAARNISEASRVAAGKGLPVFPAGTKGWRVQVDGKDLGHIFKTRADALTWVVNGIQAEGMEKGAEWLGRQFMSQADGAIVPHPREIDNFLARYDSTWNPNRVGQDPRTGFLTVTSPFPKGGTQAPRSSTSRGAFASSMFTPVMGGGGQGGFISPQLATTMGSAAVGGLIGYKEGGVEGAVSGAFIGAAMGLAVGYGLPALLSRRVPRVGDVITNTLADAAQHMDSNFLYSSADTMLRKSGAVGTEAANLLEIQRLQSDGFIGGRQFKLEQAFLDSDIHPNVMVKWMYSSGLRRVPQEHYDDVISGMQDIKLRPALLLKNPSLVKVWKVMDSIFDDTAKNALRTKVWTKEQYDKFQHKRRTEGYWPRYYNEAYLSTAKGRQHWIDVWAKTSMSEAEIIRIIQTLTGSEGPGLLAKFIVPTKGGFTLTAEGAIAMLRHREKGHELKPKLRAPHLEEDRVLALPREGMFSPFLVDDPLNVMGNYLSETSNRTTAAEIWGAKDELYGQMAAEISKLHGRDVTEAFEQAYATTQRDASSKILQQYYPSDAALWQRGKDIIHRADNAMLLSLSFGSLVQLTQVPLNAMTFLSTRPGGVRGAMTHLKKGFVDFTKGNDEVTGVLGRYYRPGQFAAESGAIAGAAVLQAIGEGARVGHSILPIEFHKLTGMAGAFNFLEILNNPTKFLHLVGFLPLEYWNRKIAALSGRSYAESLLMRQRDIQEGRITDAADIKRIHGSLQEIYIDPRLPWDAIPEGMLLRSAHQFADLINHRNAPTTLPLILQSPHFKFATRFKTFLYHQSTFLKENVFKPALPFLPRYRDTGQTGGVQLQALLTYFAVGSGLGIGSEMFRRFLLADDTEFTMTEQWFNGMSRVASLGLAYEALLTQAYSASGAWNFLGGPMISKGGQFVTAGLESLVNPLARSLISDKPQEMDPKKLFKAIHKIAPTYPGKAAVTDKLFGAAPPTDAFGKYLANIGKVSNPKP
jgi:hypothetical protein